MYAIFHLTILLIYFVMKLISDILLTPVIPFLVFVYKFDIRQAVCITVTLTKTYLSRCEFSPDVGLLIYIGSRPGNYYVVTSAL